MKHAMKKSLLALSLSLAMVGAHAASTTQEAAGCGVGTMIFKDKTGLLYSLLAGTTNGYLSGTVSMTLGILDCPESASIKGKIATFIDFNKQQLAVETAQGQGEHLAALVEMYGVKEADRTAAVSALKANQTAIFSGASTAEIQAALDKTLQAFIS
ncbi:MAG: DUF3015 family protein [Sideroxydans sp.]